MENFQVGPGLPRGRNRSQLNRPSLVHSVIFFAYTEGSLHLLLQMRACVVCSSNMFRNGREASFLSPSEPIPGIATVGVLPGNSELLAQLHDLVLVVGYQGALDV